MTSFPLHTLMTAPGGSKPFIAQAQRSYGRVPNLIAELAESPQAIEAYFMLGAVLENSALTARERQIVLLTVSVEHHCHYCTAVHAREAARQGVAMPALDAVQRGEPIGDTRLDALRAFTAALVRSRGAGGKDEAGQMLALGFERAALLDIVIAVAQKTLSTYVNHMAETPIDDWLNAAPPSAPVKPPPRQ